MTQSKLTHSSALVLRPGLVSTLLAAALPLAPAWAEGDAETASGPLEAAGIPGSVVRGTLYGFIEARFEKSADSPTTIVGTDGKPTYETNPHEFTVPALHVMMQALIAERFRVFLNLAAPGSGDPTGDEAAVVRNAWVELPLYGSYFNVRVGKTYRRFGLYNEQLDAVPSFPGIEPPELFDKDHLMLTRTTNFMIHGEVALGDANLAYAVMSGNDEREDDQFPLGFDLRLDVGPLRLGSSFYTTNGNAVPTSGVGDGSPNGGVINWMATDSYFVFGGYGQLNWQGLLVQAEYWQARHEGRRDPAEVLKLLEANLGASQKARFGLAGATPTEADVVVDATYQVQTVYVRAAYEIPLTSSAPETGLTWTLTPYVQADYYSNPETIWKKSFGGDAEAGIADDGSFVKLTVGGILRPIPEVAVKLDGSMHLQKVAGVQTLYPELRLSFAYYWEIAG